MIFNPNTQFLSFSNKQKFDKNKKIYRPTDPIFFACWWKHGCIFLGLSQQRVCCFKKKYLFEKMCVFNVFF